ncbi:uncharacterized protein LOC128546352 [Mercenaria mercenaria]|uniref:uncharacterized protein LOC128546352 n=1 Tax=Mercenaria mercenaria TaxID=6596 RepID=UPI00234EAFF0|nr:uncharacterized protein LOC128546352 [Mercenaria mercenaria]
MVGMTYTFHKVVLKPDNSMWVVSSSRMMLVKEATVSDDIQVPLLPEEEPPTGSKRSVRDALSSPSKSTIQVKVVRVSPLKFRCEGTLPVRSIGVKDKFDYAKIVAFDKCAEDSYEPNKAIGPEFFYFLFYRSAVPKYCKTQIRKRFKFLSLFLFFRRSLLGSPIENKI